MISVITAFYNSSQKIKYLRNSLLYQTDKDFEWIIVDDCSKKDEYDSLLNQLSCNDMKVIIKHNEKNIGPGGARTVGLNCASGEYVTFVDSDDYVSSNFVESINHSIGDSLADIIAFDYAFLKGNNKISCNKIDNSNEGNVEIKQFIQNVKTCICGGAFSRKLIIENRISFPNLYRYEDWVFNIRAATNCHSIWYCKKELYFYVEENTSLVKSGKYDAGDFSIQAYDLIEPALKSFSDDVKQLLFSREVIYVNAVSKAKILYSNDYKIFINNLLQKCPNWHKNKLLKQMPLHQRMILQLVSLRAYLALRIVLKII